MKKKCSKCKIEKPINLFGNCKTNKDNKMRMCKECKRVVDQGYRELHIEEAKIYQKAYRERTGYNKKYYESHKDYFAANIRKYNKENREWFRQYEKNKKETDLNYLIAGNLRSRLYCAIKNEQKNGSAIQDLGITISELIDYLKLKFYSNPKSGEMMTWENYGFRGWHIDHIIPLASFDLTDRQQLLKAVHYSNLQPLWWFENLSKSDKMFVSEEKIYENQAF